MKIMRPFFRVLLMGGVLTFLNTLSNDIDTLLSHINMLLNHMSIFQDDINMFLNLIGTL